MRTTRVISGLLVWVSAVTLAGVGQTGSNKNRLETDRQRAAVNYDRMGVLERWVQVLYPEFSRDLVTLRIAGTLQGPIYSIEIYPCTMAVRVPHQDVQILPPQSPSNNAAQKPWCTTDPTPPYKEFFHGSISFGPKKNRPILEFSASGDFLNALQLTNLVKQFRNQSLDKSQIAEALTQRKAFGPNKQKLFVEQVPFNGIKMITGCTLDPKSASLTLVETGHYPPDLQWALLGTVGIGRAAKSCKAFFEPINGRLIYFAE